MVSSTARYYLNAHARTDQPDIHVVVTAAK